MNWTASGLCPVAGFGTHGVGSLDSVTRELVMNKVSNKICLYIMQLKHHL